MTILDYNKWAENHKKYGYEYLLDKISKWGNLKVGWLYDETPDFPQQSLEDALMFLNNYYVKYLSHLDISVHAVPLESGVEWEFVAHFDRSNPFGHKKELMLTFSENKFPIEFFYIENPTDECRYVKDFDIHVEGFIWSEKDIERWLKYFVEE